MLHPLQIVNRRHYAATSRRQAKGRAVTANPVYARPKIDDY